jgi:hypothetical protein
MMVSKSAEVSSATECVSVSVFIVESKSPLPLHGVCQRSAGDPTRGHGVGNTLGFAWTYD